MDGSAFDRLYRALVTAGSRRGVLGLLSGLPMAGILNSGRDTAAKPGHQTHRRHASPHRQRGEHEGDNARGEACIPTGKRCPAKKPRGKKTRKLGCTQCCQQTTATNASGKRVCACQPTGATCTADTAFTCCTGICTNGTCRVSRCPDCSGTTPICQGDSCVACTNTSQCAASTVCAPSGACQPCTVSGGGATLAGAVAAASAGATLYVCAGTYDGGFTVATTLTIIGAGDGPDGTIIQGGSPVVEIDAGTAAQPVTLERLRIQNGIQGVHISVGRALTMRDCTVRGNQGGAFGAGIANFGSPLALTRCTVENNSTPDGGLGGGLFNAGEQATLTDCLIQGNTAPGGGGGGGLGGGIYNPSSGVMTLTGTRVTDNTAGFGECSGICNVPGSTVTLQGGSTVCANHPTTNQCVNVTGPGCTDTCPA